MNDNQPRDVPPLVSVLVPSYRHAHYIEECLDSVRDEDWPSLELLVLDDCSTDDSYRIASTWAARHEDRFERIAVAQNDVNRGVGATMNRLVGMSRGEYLVPLASDDLLIRGGIRTRVEALRSSRSPRGAVIGDAWLVDERGRRREESAFVTLHRADKKALSNARTIRRELILNWSVPGPVLMFHRSLLEQVGGQFYLEGVVAEDRELYLRIMAQDALTFVDEPIAWYRRHSLSASLTQSQTIALEAMTAERAHAPAFPRDLRFLLHLVAGIAEGKLTSGRSLPQRVSTFALRVLRKVLLFLNRFSASFQSWGQRG